MALLKQNSSQREISRYLFQIRKAINKDFVPFFLGANRSRKIILKHNNISTKKLHDMGKKDLALFADATYTRIEKKSNNKFQYNTWSGQKIMPS